MEKSNPNNIFPQANVISNEFLPIHRLQEIIKQAEKAGIGWPNVILNVKERQNYRPDVKGTLSLFSNISGTSNCEVDNKRLNVHENLYLLSNDQQTYTLDINTQIPLETFNVHFGTNFLQETYYELSKKDQILLESPEVSQYLQIDFNNQLFRKSSTVEHIITILHQQQSHLKKNSILLEEYLHRLLSELIQAHRTELSRPKQLESLKKSTKDEIWKRLKQAIEYIHSNYCFSISLDKLAEVSSLSKFHFLRLFKQAFQESPHQYIKSLRLEKATYLLKKTLLPIQDIAYFIGFEAQASFSRAFKNKYGVNPIQYRLML